jgi:starvation-inducible DNA-binding protein
MSAPKILKEVLASTYVLYLNTQKAHWNVTGPQFHSLHEMFEGQYKGLAAAIDTLAERIRALNELAPGSFEEFNKLSKVSGMTDLESDSTKLVQSLLVGHETILHLLKEGLDKVDPATEDLFIERIQHHDEIVWMLKSMIA